MYSFPMKENFRTINDECFNESYHESTKTDEDVLYEVLNGGLHDLTQLTESDIQEHLIDEIGSNPSLFYLYARSMMKASNPFELQKVAQEMKEYFIDQSLKLVERLRDDVC